MPLGLTRRISEKKNHFLKGVSMPSGGLHEGLVLLKDLPKHSRLNRTYMCEKKSFLKI